MLPGCFFRKSTRSEVQLGTTPKTWFQGPSRPSNLTMVTGFSSTLKLKPVFQSSCGKKKTRTLPIPSTNCSESEVHILWPSRPYKTLGHSQNRPTDIWNRTRDDHSIVKGKKHLENISDLPAMTLSHILKFLGASHSRWTTGEFRSYISFRFDKSQK